MRIVLAPLLVVAWWASAYAGFDHVFSLPTWGPWLAAIVGSAVAPFAAAGFIARRATILAGALAVYGTVGLLAVLRALGAWGSQVSEGTPESVLALWLGICSLCALTLGPLVSALPGDRRALSSIACIVALCGLCAAGAAAAVATGPGACARFELTRAHWQAHREAVADAIVRCRALEGMDRAAVRRVLGGERNQRSWRAGGGFWGERRLSLEFSDGRVTAAYVSEASWD